MVAAYAELSAQGWVTTRPGGSSAVAATSPDVAPRRFASRYHVRVQAANSGSEPDNNPPCNGPVAAIWIHDLMDGNPYSGNHDVALPRALKMNGCTKLDFPADWTRPTILIASAGRAVEKTTKIGWL